MKYPQFFDLKADRDQAHAILNWVEVHFSDGNYRYPRGPREFFSKTAYVRAMHLDINRDGFEVAAITICCPTEDDVVLLTLRYNTIIKEYYWPF